MRPTSTYGANGAPEAVLKRRRQNDQRVEAGWVEDDTSEGPHTLLAHIQAGAAMPSFYCYGVLLECFTQAV